MLAFNYVDLFKTYDIEYLLIIIFLLVLIPFRRILNAPPKLRK
jgi:hypothetical protein